MYSNMKYNENICICLRVIQQDINRKLNSANCWQRTSLIPNYDIMLMQYTAIFHGCKNDNFQLNFLTIPAPPLAPNVSEPSCKETQSVEKHAHPRRSVKFAYKGNLLLALHFLHTHSYP